MPLFEVALIETPRKKKDEEDWQPERLVFGPACIVAKDSQSAAIKAVIENTGAMAKVDKDRMQVLVRPFA